MINFRKKPYTLSSTWEKFGETASENHKNLLITKIIEETTKNDIHLDSTENWLSFEMSQSIMLPIVLINDLKEIDSTISGYVVFSSSEIREIVIKSEKYDECIFDGITDVIMKYEKEISKRIDFYYVEKISFFPESSLKF